MPLACLSTRAERKMKGLFLTGVGRLELLEVPVPKVTAGMLRIRVCRAGVCSTDVGYWRSGSPRLRLPVILGLTAALAAKAMGCRVILAGVSKDVLRLHTARDLDIPYVVNSEKKIWRQS